jgi:hypothetical protein
MSKRIDKSWLVFVSVENPEHDRCVDFFSRPDGSSGFEEFRRDVEDGGQRTPVQYYSGVSYASPAKVLDTAVGAVEKRDMFRWESLWKSGGASVETAEISSDTIRSQRLLTPPARQPISQKPASRRVASLKIAINSASRAGVA